MKISTNQIITALVALMVGIGATLLVTGKDDDQKNVVKTADEVVVDADTSTGQTKTDDEIKEAEKATASSTSTAKTTTPSASTANTNVKTVTGDCKTGLSARKDEKLNAIVLGWTPCASDDFQFYKLVKSSKNASPSYPADPVAYSSSNKNAASFVDKTVAQRTTYYYRLCVVQRLGAINCSNVASASF